MALNDQYALKLELMELKKLGITRFQTIPECKKLLMDDLGESKSEAEIRDLARTGKVKALYYGKSRTRMRVDFVSLALYSPSASDSQRRSRRMRRKVTQGFDNSAELTPQADMPLASPVFVDAKQSKHPIIARLGM